MQSLLYRRCAVVAAPWLLLLQRLLLLVLLLVTTACGGVVSFQPLLNHQLTQRSWSFVARRRLPAAASTSTPTLDEDAVANMQWTLLLKHHVQPEKAVNNMTAIWKGLWTTYDDMGNVLLDSVASVNYHYVPEDNSVAVSHSIVTGSVQSDCETCHDDEQVQTFPVATYTPTSLASKKVTLGACGMVIGPSVLARTGAGTCVKLRVCAPARSAHLVCGMCCTDA
jgi:azurin